jgi:hypothetical protein
MIAEWIKVEFERAGRRIVQDWHKMDAIERERVVVIFNELKPFVDQLENARERTRTQSPSELSNLVGAQDPESPSRF